MDAKSKLKPKEPFEVPMEEEEAQAPPKFETEKPQDFQKELDNIMRRADELKQKVAQAQRIRNPEVRQENIDKLSRDIYDTAYDTYSLVYEFQAKLERIEQNTNQLVAYINKEEEPRRKFLGLF